MNAAFAQKIAGDFVVLHIPYDISNSEIDDIIRQALPMAMRTNRGWCCAIAGYDQDERELYQIPEVTELCERLCERGLIAIMHVSTLMDKEEHPQIRRFFGAMEIWAVATGTLKANGELDISPEMMEVFLEVLDKANKTANLLLPVTTDGQHRTKSV